MTKEKTMMGIVVASAILIAISISYAYFTATFQNLGERETTITAAEMGSLKLTATEATYTSGNQYPGDMAIQKFTVEPVSKGKGVYELDLTGVIDESIFGTDVEIQLYKSLDNTEVTITEGELTQNGTQFSRVDTLVTNGLTPIYNNALKNGLNILYQEEFEVIEESGTLKVREDSESTAYPKYTFYLVYNYKNNGNQNNQMGQAFNGTISARLIEMFPAAKTLMTLASNTSPESTGVIDYGTDFLGCTNTLAYDDFGNIRYVGANPCNYVTFNEESPGFADVYLPYLNGALITRRFPTYSTEEECISNLENIKTQLGIDSDLECAYDSTNRFYYTSGQGFMPKIAYEDYYVSIDDCMGSMWSSGLTSESTGLPPSSITCEKSGKIVSGGWRIIGVFDGQIKLIRNDSIGSYSWDSSASSINSGYGINQWGESGDYKGADLMKLLNPEYDNNLAEDATGNTISGTYANNSLYWNRGSGNCYDSQNNGKKTCDFSTTGLTELAKSMIDKHTWNLGSNDGTTYTYNNIKAKQFYELERSNNTGKICTSGSACNDTVNRTTTWDGYVGLMSQSDYGYAVGGEVRTNCLENTYLFNYMNSDCYKEDWLFFTSDHQAGSIWTLSIQANGYSAYDVFDVRYSGGGIFGHVLIPYSVHPSLYLVPEASISGNGTPTNPFTVSLE